VIAIVYVVAFFIVGEIHEIFNGRE
jgi:hypothetical protein